jgi:hypothetical protein
MIARCYQTRMDGHGPVIEEIAADGKLVIPMMVLLGVVGLERDGQQIIHKRFLLSAPLFVLFSATLFVVMPPPFIQCQ